MGTKSGGIKVNNKRMIVLMTVIITLAIVFCIDTTYTYADDSGVNSKPTLKQLRDKYNEAGTPPLGEACFETPVNTSAYTPGVLSPGAYNYAEKYINYMRYQAGLGPITLNSALNDNAAQGALIMARNNKFGHDQAVPSGVSEAAAKPGRYATMASNISSSSSWPSPDNMSIVQDAIKGQMDDNSGNNLQRVGHRRWLLKPSTSTMGIGSALLVNRGGWNEAYTSVRIMNRPNDSLYDSSFGTVQSNNSTNYDFVSWPSSGYMLNEAFDNNTPWSIHINESRYQAIPDSAQVEITRQSDNKKWTLDNSSPNTLTDESQPHISSDYFKISNNSNQSIVGEGHTLIFCPDPNELGSGKLKDTFNVKITGLKTSSGALKTLEYSVTFAGLRPNLDEMSISLNNNSFEYTGQEVKPSATVLYDGTQLIEGTDYTITYSNNTNVTNEAKATITGKGTYEGTVEKTFSITPKKVNVPEAATDLVYSGQTQHGVKESADYTAESGSGIDAGSYTATLALKDKTNTTWSDGSLANKTVNWSIAPKSLTGQMLNMDSTLTYNGENQKATVTVKDGSLELNEGTDYTLTNNGGTNVGEYDVTIAGKGNYSGSATKKYNIVAKAIDDRMISLNKEELPYSGANQKPEVTVKDGSRDLAEGTDYTLTNNGGTNVGEYEVTIAGKGNYSGSVTKKYNIVAKAIDAQMINLNKEIFAYSGEQQKPEVTVTDGINKLAEGTDYELTNIGGTDAGEYKVSVEGKGNYNSTAEKSYTITPKTIATAEVTADPSSFVYTGSEIKPSVSVKLDTKELSDKDYTVSYSNNINAGDATITVIGKNNYKDSAYGSFAITKADNQISITASGWKEGSTPVNPKVTSKFGSDKARFTYSTDADGTYSETIPNTPGTYFVKATIPGTDNYNEAESEPVSFVISNATTPITGATVTGIVAKRYNGRAQVQNPTVKVEGATLKNGTDYTLSYRNNIHAGTATVVITGKGNYTGSISKTFTINQAQNTLLVAGNTVTVSHAKLKTANQYIPVGTVRRIVRGGQGTITYMKVAGTNKITVSKQGKIMVGKGLAKGRYRFILRVICNGRIKCPDGVYRYNYNVYASNATVTVLVK